MFPKEDALKSSICAKKKLLRAWHLSLDGVCFSISYRLDELLKSTSYNFLLYIIKFVNDWINSFDIGKK